MFSLQFIKSKQGERDHYFVVVVVVVVVVVDINKNSYLVLGLEVFGSGVSVFLVLLLLFPEEVEVGVAGQQITHSGFLSICHLSISYVMK